MTIRQLAMPLLIFLYCLQCDMVDSSGTNEDPFIEIPDSSQIVFPPTNDPEPVLTVLASSDAGLLLEAAVDSLSMAKRGGTIRFIGGDGPVVITLSRPLNVVARDTPMVIDGGGRITLSGNGSCRIVECSHYANLVLKNINLVKGSADSSGGAIMHPWYGSLACYGVTFRDNGCLKRGPEFGGGAVFAGGLTRAVFSHCAFIRNRGSNGGAILNRGSNLTIDSCTFIENIATGDGGGKDAGASGQGGLGGGVYIDGMNYDSAQPLYLARSIFTDNVAHCHGSAVFAYYYKNKPGTSGALVTECGFYDNRDSGSITSTGTLYHEGSPLRLHASTFSGNTTLKHAGALFLGPDATTEIINCTFYGNRTPGNGGAIFGGKQRISIWNCTFCANEGSYGPAIFNDTPDAVTVYNTIFTGNIPIVNQYAYRNCTATYSNGANVIQWPAEKANGNPDNLCIPDAQFIDPLIDSPAANGGLTPTMALREGSPAIGICDSCPPTDQRGVARKGRCDAGAYERE